MKSNDLYDIYEVEQINRFFLIQMHTFYNYCRFFFYWRIIFRHAAYVHTNIRKYPRKRHLSAITASLN